MAINRQRVKQEHQDGPDKMSLQQPTAVTPGCPAMSSSGSENGKRKVREYDCTVDHLQVLLESEAQTYGPCSDYLALFEASPICSQERVSDSWRRKLCEWCYEVVDHFGFDREAVFFALNYLDRTVAARAQTSEEPPSKRKFQLLAVTALYIALKLHGSTDNCEGPRRKLKVDSFVQLSRGFFTVENIEEAEREMLATLRWGVHPPTSLRFITYFLRLLPMWSPEPYTRSHQQVISSVVDVARYLAELAVCSSECTIGSRSSVIAYVCVVSALDVMQHKLPTPYHVRVDFLKSLADVTGLVPESSEVKRYQAAIKELCPSLFENQDLPPEFDIDRSGSELDSMNGDRVSPVSVMMDGGNDARRKRSRTEACAGSR